MFFRFLLFHTLLYSLPKAPFAFIANLNICDKVIPVDVKDGAETTLMEVLEQSEVAPAGHPHLGAVEKNGENYRSVDKDLGFVLQVLVMPHPFVQSTEGTVCLSKPVVHFFVYSGI